MKKNYLLVMPKFVRRVGDGYAFPLGILYISASMKQNNYKVHALNLNQIDGDIGTILSDVLRKYHIDVVATGGMCLDYSNVKVILDAVKKYDSNILTIVGGAIITGDAEASMIALETADYGIIGEGEITMSELCAALECNADVKEIEGLIYRAGFEYKRTGPRKDIVDLNSLPWPDYDSFGFKEYMEHITPANVVANKRNTLFMLTSRSCPYKCTFCFHPEGITYRQRSIDDVFGEIDSLTKRYKIDYIFFVDELFGTYMKRLQEFCQRIKKYNLKGWYSFFRADQITKEKLFLLKEAGCSCMFFGLESADNRILKSMNKNMTIEKIEETLKLVQQERIALDGNFIFGDVEETLETSMNTLKWWRDHSQYKINLGNVAVYPGSDLYKYALKNRIITDRVQYLKDRCPDINVSKMTDQEYEYVMDIIAKERRKLSESPQDMKITKLNYHKAQYDLQFTCDKCHKKYVWNDINMFGFNYLSCDQCGQMYNLPIPDQTIVYAEINLKNILNKYKKIAIWGVNEIAELFLSKITTVADDNIYIIDNSSKKKKDIYDKKTYEPKFIRENGIHVVIIAVTYHFDTIRTQIGQNHFDVERVIDISELISDSFIL